MLACTKAENQSVIELLLEKGADLFFVNKDGWNCCHLAAREGNAKIVKILIQSAKDEDRIKKLVNLKSRNGRKPLHTAGTNYKAFRFAILTPYILLCSNARTSRSDQAPY